MKYVLKLILFMFVICFVPLLTLAFAFSKGLVSGIIAYLVILAAFFIYLYIRGGTDNENIE